MSEKVKWEMELFMHHCHLSRMVKAPALISNNIIGLTEENIEKMESTCAMVRNRVP